MIERNVVAGLTGGLLLAIGAAGSVACFYAHICMVGHMHHPPYPPGTLALDTAWAAFMVVGGLLSTFWRPRAGLCITLAAGAFLVFRFGLGSLGGLLPLPI